MVLSKSTAQEYLSCLFRLNNRYPDIVVDGGDSGSPVFIKANDIQDDLEVILVGVIYGYDSWGTMFVPIDRVYAELLGQGYDWSPDFLRPVDLTPRLVSLASRVQP